MGKKENQRVRLTKKLLKDSLIQLLHKKSLDKITVSELCADAEINRSTFYVYYGSPYDVLEDISDDLIEHLKNTLEQYSGSHKLTIEKQIELLCNDLRANSEIAKIVFSYHSADSSFVVKLFEMRLKDATAFQNIQDYPSEKKALIETFFINGIYSAIRMWILNDFSLSSVEIGKLAKNITRVFS